ncbi:hypothetical protein KDW55_00535 [Burkholderia sp. AU19243]|uniref:hypothetical protein n=1 Tax=Burkholderia sp. AU19243 TaxID=2824810 RepID=UPI001B95082C|nr:hypothetical protein [Burkholderia sp. AU19243]MBR8140853.1 hypothetical protein [Burkholderia vietnamiensis]MBR8361810.1 hypothetical protein [Burkholderia sp. AU19243]
MVIFDFDTRVLFGNLNEMQFGSVKNILRGLALAIVMSIGIGLPDRASYAGLLEDEMSMDATPIDIELAGARYRIPRNYLYNMDDWNGGAQKNVSIRVVYPGFKPFGPGTKDCMLKLNGGHCRIYDVYVTENLAVSEIGFNNFKRLFREPYPKNGPYGFQLFEIGPDNSRIEFYRKNIGGMSIVFDCSLDKSYADDAICHHVARTESGATISYFFVRSEGLGDAVEVDLGLRALIDSFYTGKVR